MNQVTPGASTSHLPSVEEMNQQLNQVDPSTQTIPQFVNPGQPLPNTGQVAEPVTSPQPNVELANTPEEPVAQNSATNFSFSLNSVFNKSKKWAVKLIGIGLTLQGLQGIYKSVSFILVTYPQLEQQLISHHISQTEVDDLAIKAIMMVISTVLSMFFAMRLTIMQSKAMKSLNTMIGILLFLGNAMIHDYFVSLNSSQMMVNGVVYLLELVRGSPEKVIEESQFIEGNLEQGLEATWYQ